MPSMSPRTQQMQQQQPGAGDGADQAEALFEKGFSDMAYNILLAKLPDLIQDIVTFKILDTDLDSGSGVGAFVVMRNDQPLYIPVVLSDNNVKPLELIYHKALNIFLPLTKGWLDEIDKTSLNALGTGVKTPETLYSDVDIRNIVVPPMTGRFSYAAWEPVILADVAHQLDLATLEKTAAEPALMLLDFLGKAPNFVKRAFAVMLEQNPRLVKHAASIYGVNALSEALRPRQEKTAAKQLTGGALWIADKDTTPLEFKRVFGDQAAEAYAGVRLKGYAARDTRTRRNHAVQEQAYARWVEPQQPGVYILTSAEHKEEPAFVMPYPVDILAGDDKRARYGRKPPTPGHNPLVDNSYYDPSSLYSRGTTYEANRVYPSGRPNEAEFALPRLTDRYLAVLKNGDYLLTERLAGRDSTADSIDGGTLHKRMFESVSGEPRTGKGFFVRAKGTTYQATVPIEIKSITTDAEGCRRIKATSLGGFGEPQTIITEKTNGYGAIWMPKGANVVYLPPDFIWVPLKEKLAKGDFFTSALDLQACVSQGLSAVGARKVAIKNAGAGQFSVDGTQAIDRVPAIKKLAHDYGLEVGVADALVKQAAADRVVRVWIASPLQLGGVQAAWDKRAADDEKKDKDKGSDKKKPAPKKPPGDAAAAGGGGPPDDSMGEDGMGGSLGEEAAMAAMAPPAPPPPSPVEMAAMEFQQHIDNEKRKLDEQTQMLMALTQRANEIAGGAPPSPSAQTQAMGVPPSPGMATGMDAPPPGIGAAPLPGTMPADPMGGDPAAAGMQGPPGMGGAEMGAMGGMPPAPGGALPMDDQGMSAPGMGGPPPGMPPGGDPSMGGMPPGADPSMDGMPPGGDPSMGGMGGAPPSPPMAMMGMDGPNAHSLSSEINPQFLQQAAQLQSADVFDAAAVSSLAQSPAIKELTAQYVPNLEKALDNLGRVELTLWMQETTLKKEIGESTFAALEDNLRNTFKSLGDLVLKLSQGSHTMPGQFENDAT